METIPSNDREQWLSDVKYTLEADGFEPFKKNIKYLFKGFVAWLTDNDVDLLLMCYQIIIGSLPEILKREETEAEFIKLIPTFIENLGSQKTVVRKSTHRCMASYVKLSLKLELVLTYIINVGLIHSKHRTRQHSMLVIPALLSLKKQAMKQRDPYIIKLMDTVSYKLFDNSEIVQKTAKKLLTELKRVYPNDIPGIIDLLSNKKNRNWCRKVLEYQLESESEEEEDEEVQQQEESYEEPNEEPKIETKVKVKNSLESRSSKAEAKIVEEKVEKKVEKSRSPKKIKVIEITDKPHIHPTPIRKEEQVREEKLDPNHKIPNKPQVTAAKTKPFLIKETPKKSQYSVSNGNRDSNSNSSPKKSSSPRIDKGLMLYDGDRKDNRTEAKIRQPPKFNEDEVKMLSNTHIFENRHETIDSTSNSHIRKSMNNLHSNSEITTTKPSEK